MRHETSSVDPKKRQNAQFATLGEPSVEDEGLLHGSDAGGLVDLDAQPARGRASGYNAEMPRQGEQHSNDETWCQASAKY